MNNDLHLTVKNKEYILPAGSVYYDLAKAAQDDFPDDIVLALKDNHLAELSRKIPGDGNVELITTSDPDGRRAYRRSVVFLMQAAAAGLYPDDKPDIHVMYSLGQGYFCLLYLDGQLVDADGEFIERLDSEMRKIAEKGCGIRKYTVSTGDAREMFKKTGLQGKERLLKYRASSNINLYELNGFSDYYYGYMVPSASYLKYFSLRTYDNGFMLLFPDQDSRKVAPFHPSHKLFQIEKNSSEWGDMMGIGTVGELNDAISRGGSKRIILMQEALMEQKIGALAEKIARSHDRKFVLIAGPSSSGKTTFSYRLSIQLRAQGLNPHPLSLDDYYRDRDKCPVDPVTGEVDLESIDCLDTELFNHDMNSLLLGEEVSLPTFNFKTQRREYHGRKMKLTSNDIIVIEGIHGLNDKMTFMIPPESKYRIYISALTQLSIDEHNPLPTTDGRLIRRIVRDSRTRGTSAAETLSRWKSVREGEEKNIFPFQESADTMFNSALIYEMAVLKLYALPELYAIDETCPEFPEAKRLIKLLNYFLPVPPESISNTSLLREFIGGSVLNV